MSVFPENTRPAERNEWVTCFNVRTGTDAVALELTWGDIAVLTHFLGRPGVTAGWWIVKYQDHSYRLFNPERFAKAYWIRKLEKERKT